MKNDITYQGIYHIQIMFVIGNQLSFAMVMRCHLMISYTSEANHTIEHQSFVQS